MGKYSIGERNAKGDRLIQFCQEEHYIISDTWFKLPIRRLYTWNSPQNGKDNVVRNQIDYVLINKRYRSNIVSAKAYPGTDVGSDHNPKIIKIRVRLKRNIKKNKNKELNVEKLRNTETPERLNKFDK